MAPADTGLEITNLTTYPLREPVSRRAYTVVKIETRSGLRGYGECGVLSAVGVTRAKQIVGGQQASGYEVIRRQLAALPGLQAAINMALLDLMGKFTKAPVYQVLG